MKYEIERVGSTVVLRISDGNQEQERWHAYGMSDDSATLLAMRLLTTVHEDRKQE